MFVEENRNCMHSSATLWRRRRRKRRAREGKREEPAAIRRIKIVWKGEGQTEDGNNGWVVGDLVLVRGESKG